MKKLASADFQMENAGGEPANIPHSPFSNPQPPTVRGLFKSIEKAERALDYLQALGAAPGDLSVSAPAEYEEGRHFASLTPEARARVAHAALAGSIFGALLGGLGGWLSGLESAAIPGYGPTLGSGVLGTFLAGLLFGAALGALLGTLVGMGAGEFRTQHGQGRPPSGDYHSLDIPHPEVATPDFPSAAEDILLSVRARAVPATRVQSILLAYGAVAVWGQNGELGTGEMACEAQETPHPESPVPHLPEGGAELALGKVQSGLQGQEEDNQVSREDTGTDPETATGTRGAVDPETGALGTAGTPMTTGYGVAGSTAGTGSEQGRREQESGEYAGSTPDTAAYEMGGRSSDDMPGSRLVGGDEPSVTEKFGSGRGEATGRGAQDAEGRAARPAGDVYAQGPSYGPTKEPSDSADAGTAASELYSSADVAEPPSYGRVNLDQDVQASSGTDIPGTQDPRGLGDNTDN